ncbi:hypothetical protein SETIT_2G250800v2 [Setaria italica]|uniref:Uncharacterized protein n=1 Tax=Setaria italica TaxID=4555 RepID=A0A368Q323_SETIT|nr:hypothetical protein SETIT_2G250800v2 [Setaria italica]
MDSEDNMHDANGSTAGDFYSGGEASLAASDDGDADYDLADRDSNDSGELLSHRQQVISGSQPRTSASASSASTTPRWSRRAWSAWPRSSTCPFQARRVKAAAAVLLPPSPSSRAPPSAACGPGSFRHASVASASLSRRHRRRTPCRCHRRRRPCCLPRTGTSGQNERSSSTGRMNRAGKVPRGRLGRGDAPRENAFLPKTCFREVLWGCFELFLLPPS